MTRGRVLIVALLAFSLAFGMVLWWSLTRAYYRELPAEAAGPVLLVPQGGGAAEALAVSGLRAIDAASSPIRFRACFEGVEAPGALAARFVPYPAAGPLVAPGWFGCFDAAAVGEALEAGEGAAFLGGAAMPYGIDRVVAVMDDGRGFAWNQINSCGEAVFNGREPPAGCPPPPEDARLTYTPDE